MREIGEVVKKNNQYVTVSLQRSEACDKCGACKMGMKSEEMQLEVENLCNAEIGDRVYIDMQHSDFFKAATIMYGLPLVMLLVGLLTGYGIGLLLKWQTGTEPLSLAVGVLMMVGTFLWIRANESKWKTQNYRPVAAEIVEHDE